MTETEIHSLPLQSCVPPSFSHTWLVVSVQVLPVEQSAPSAAKVEEKRKHFKECQECTISITINN